MATNSASMVRSLDVSGKMDFQFLFQFQCQESFYGVGVSRGRRGSHTPSSVG